MLRLPGLQFCQRNSAESGLVLIHSNGCANKKNANLSAHPLKVIYLPAAADESDGDDWFVGGERLDKVVKEGHERNFSFARIRLPEYLTTRVVHRANHDELLIFGRRRMECQMRSRNQMTGPQEGWRRWIAAKREGGRRRRDAGDVGDVGDAMCSTSACIAHAQGRQCAGAGQRCEGWVAPRAVLRYSSDAAESR